VALGRDLAEACARSTREIAADLRSRVVRAADELAGALFDAQSGTMTVGHSHVRAIAVEPDELVGALTETLVIVAGHAHVRFEPRKTADSARETLWNRQHLRSREAAYVETGAGDQRRGERVSCGCTAAEGMSGSIACIDDPRPRR
jgi:hypothetical protein